MPKKVWGVWFTNPNDAIFGWIIMITFPMVVIGLIISYYLK